jgi:hypothetical protein
MMAGAQGRDHYAQGIARGTRGVAACRTARRMPTAQSERACVDGACPDARDPPYSPQAALLSAGA